MSIINANGWPLQAIALQRTISAIAAPEASGSYTPQPMSVVASTSQSQSGSSTSQQSYQDAQDEAFAKLKVALDNTGSSAGAAKSSAAQEFSDYMSLSPEEKIHQKMLTDMGLTQEEYEALPPVQKEAIDKQVAQQLQDQTAQKSLAGLG